MLVEIKEPQAAEMQPKKRGWSRLLTLVVLSAAALYVAATGVGFRQASHAKLRQTAETRAIPNVSAAPPGTQGSVTTLDLPGRLEAYSRASLFARVNGYIANWKADIGAVVKAGDVLAEIEAPDLDQQLLQAQSDLANSKITAELADVTNQRFQALLPNKTISRQVSDEKAADLSGKRLQVKSAEANVERLKSMAQFKRIVAPFDGIVTARNTDVGALINAGSTSGSGLFVVSDTRRLRLIVAVPQAYAPLVKAGTVARLTVPERPGQSFMAKVEAVSGAVDIASGTMRSQLVVDNAEGKLLPGAFANVHFEVPTGRDVLSVPASALIFDKIGLRVAAVDRDGKVSLKTITIARDAGKTVEVASGLTREDNVIESPPDGIVDGDKVNVKAPPVSAKN